jgi:hypothetical protein
MRERQESIIIFRAACFAGLAVSAAITAGGLFLDFVTPLYDADAPRLLPGAAAVALKGLPVWIALLAAFGHAAHFSLKQRGLTREIHYILASMAALYSLFVAGSFWAPAGDGTLMALAGGLPVSLILAFPLGISFRRLVVMRPVQLAHRFETAGISYFARLNH